MMVNFKQCTKVIGSITVRTQSFSLSLAQDIMITAFLIIVVIDRTYLDKMGNRNGQCLI